MYTSVEWIVTLSGWSSGPNKKIVNPQIDLIHPFEKRLT